MRAAWSAAGGIVTAVCGTNAVAWAVGAGAAHSPLPVWPAYTFGSLAVGGCYLIVAPLARLWPFHRLVAPAELLDDCLRLGREARERIIREQLDSWGVARVAGTWQLRTMNRLDRHLPHLADAFMLASGNEENFSGQALVINTLNAKMGVLIEARSRIGG
jgi:hypothetical protein